jgi:hypothetical protein
MPAVHQPARPQGDQDQPVINALDMEYFPPQPWLFNSPLLLRLKHLFYFGTVV